MTTASRPTWERAVTLSVTIREPVTVLFYDGGFTDCSISPTFHGVYRPNSGRNEVCFPDRVRDGRPAVGDAGDHDRGGELEELPASRAARAPVLLPPGQPANDGGSAALDVPLSVCPRLWHGAPGLADTRLPAEELLHPTVLHPAAVCQASRPRASTCTCT